MIDGVAVGHCGAFWTCKSIAVCESCASFGKKVTAESHFRSCKTLTLDSKKLLDCVLVHYQQFCGFRQVDSPACVLKLQFNCLPRLNVCNDLAEAMKALDGKKDLGLQEVVLPSSVEKNDGQTIPQTLIQLRHAKTFLCESLVRGCTVY